MYIIYKVNLKKEKLDLVIFCPVKSYFNFQVQKTFQTYRHEEIQLSLVSAHRLCYIISLYVKVFVVIDDCYWEILLRWADLAALPTIAPILFRAHHVNRVLLTFSSKSPIGAVWILIYTATASACSTSWWYIERPHVNPLCCRPFLTFDDRTTPVQTWGISSCIRMKTEKQQCITLLRFHCHKRTRKCKTRKKEELNKEQNKKSIG